jgi:hypothetical protein
MRKLGTLNYVDMECKNCGETLHGEYCSACGQKLITQRLTLRHIFSELFNIITNVDRGFLHTAKMLLVAPGEMIRNYLQGQTRRYYPPLRYVVLLVAISVAINLWFGVFDQQQSEISSMMGEQPKVNEEVQRVQQQFNEGLKKYLNVIPLVLIPIISLFSYLFFRKKGWNYAEHLVLNAYLQGQLALIGLPFIITGVAVSMHFAVQAMYAILIIGIFYAAYVYKNFFRVNMLQAFLKYLFTFLITYFIFMLVGAIGMIAYLISSGAIK